MNHDDMLLTKSQSKLPITGSEPQVSCHVICSNAIHYITHDFVGSSTKIAYDWGMDFTLYVITDEHAHDLMHIIVCVLITFVHDLFLWQISQTRIKPKQDDSHRHAVRSITHNNAGSSTGNDRCLGQGFHIAH